VEVDEEEVSGGQGEPGALESSLDFEEPRAEVDEKVGEEVDPGPLESSLDFGILIEVPETEDVPEEVEAQLVRTRSDLSVCD